MASVRLKPHSAHWFACFRLATGDHTPSGAPVFRRVQRTTGPGDKSRALQLALTYERAATLAAERRFTEVAARKFLAEIRAISEISSTDVEPAAAFLAR
ncbi:MAG: hypothetical protein ABIQ12_02340, partial [Opitutaceae bacterium]